MKSGLLFACAMAMVSTTAEAQSPGTFPELQPIDPVESSGAVFVPRSFSADSLSWSVAPGPNRITGDAILRTRGGDIRSCAGTRAQLWPVDGYVTDWVVKPFGFGSLAEPDKFARIMTGLEPGVHRFVRLAPCNSQGVFTFDNLPNGHYVVIANVSWEVPNLRRSSSSMDIQGGYLIESVVVKGGQTATITLTR